MQSKLKELEKKHDVGWREYEIGELFEISPTKNYGLSNDELRKNLGNTLVVSNTSYSNGTFMRSSLKPTEKANQITFSDTTTDEGIFYQPYEFIGYSHVQKMVPKFNDEVNVKIGQYFVSAIRATVRGKYSYGTKMNRANIAKEKITLPTKNSEIAFDYIEEFVETLEAERLQTLEAERLQTLEAYLSVTDLKDTVLTAEEESALTVLMADEVKWNQFNVEQLFGKSTRGRRLKSQDRISGNLPFVTAGEAGTGISAFIGNKVHIFDKNTVTIDMFGSSKYRSYKYGADDHVAVVHTEKLDKFAAVFVASAAHKSAHAGQFDYSRNFYATDADELMISLPVDSDGNIDYDFMSNLMSAMQKIVIKDVVEWSNKKIGAMRSIIGNQSRK